MKKIIALFCLAALTTAGIAVTYNQSVNSSVTADAGDKDKDKDKDKKKKDCCAKDAAAAKACHEGASSSTEATSTEGAVKATETGSAGSAATPAAAKSCCKGAGAAKSCDKKAAPNP